MSGLTHHRGPLIARRRGITFVGSSQLNTASTSSIALPKPTGSAGGDVVVLFISSPGNPTLGLGGNYTELDSATAAGEGSHLLVRLMDGTEGSNLPAISCAASRVQAACAVYRGVKFGSIVSAKSASINSNTVTAPSVTLSEAGVLVCMFTTHQTVVTAWSTPTGMTELQEAVSGNGGIELSDQVIAAAGATGTRDSFASGVGGSMQNRAYSVGLVRA